MSLLRNSHCVYRYSTDQESNGSLNNRTVHEADARVSGQSGSRIGVNEARSQKKEVYNLFMFFNYEAPCSPETLPHYFTAELF